LKIPLRSLLLYYISLFLSLHLALTPPRVLITYLA